MSLIDLIVVGCLVPKSGAEYAYLMEAFGKKGKFWGPLPAFVCGWVYVMILRPAEIAIIILTFAKYTIIPFHNVLGLEYMSEEQREMVTKLVALLALGNEGTVLCYFLQLIYIFRHHNVHKSR